MNRPQKIDAVARARAEYARILRKYHREERRLNRHRQDDNEVSRLYGVISRIARKINSTERKQWRSTASAKQAHAR